MGFVYNSQLSLGRIHSEGPGYGNPGLPVRYTPSTKT